jgi:hypothetical protein
MGNLYGNMKLYGSKSSVEAIFLRMNFDLLIVKKDQNISLVVIFIGGEVYKCTYW